ncbi:hypothetical protein BDW02DRAFT_19846 [Decorospora gaudefroyi]|uniref:Uncharacterized protein n=1 Tax=Decorospora gaudefroyi TaxID=184978 RepID=A0A6A5KFQ8_9PLEO|nr:hypothetical protein BDW02DRAFT_19846 [Decorospora gaudefroyi]
MMYSTNTPLVIPRLSATLSRTPLTRTFECTAPKSRRSLYVPLFSPPSLFYPSSSSPNNLRSIDPTIQQHSKINTHTTQPTNTMHFPTTLLSALALFAGSVFAVDASTKTSTMHWVETVYTKKGRAAEATATADALPVPAAEITFAA